jgi:glycosyltransferase involved in cell wall biosynthesis
MRLLIVTQKVDINDDILGFFHRWLIEFGKHFEYITVICLQKGEYNLPKNINVLSLGKEKGGWRVSKIMRYIGRFYKYIWNERKNYDAVFVHMNPEYIVLVGLFWKIIGKSVFLWYNHKKGGIRARIAEMFSKKVFYTSAHSFMARFSKAHMMPVGVDTAFFKRDKNIGRKKKYILSLGRISPVKKIDVLINALIELDRRDIDYRAYIYGNSAQKDRKYYGNIRNSARILENKNKVLFHAGVPHAKIPSIYNEAQVFVNLTAPGSLDKTIVEAMSCETLVIVENQSLKDSIPREFLFNGSAGDLADKIEYVFSLPDSERQRVGEFLRCKTVEKHSLDNLASELSKALKKQKK